jgi:uncharacterized protein YdhG (YjbR/CyaY superfamily)
MIPRSRICGKEHGYEFDASNGFLRLNVIATNDFAARKNAGKRLFWIITHLVKGSIEGNFMENDKKGFSSTGEYIATFPAEIQLILQQMRATIQAAAPEAEEKISYQMPTFYLNGNLVHFAAFKNHIGFYPTPGGIEAFEDELSVYQGAKGSIRFPIDQALPLELITKIVKLRVAENLKKAEAKSGKRKG